MKKVGYVGWRGMVGSVLCERMEQEADFEKYENYFFTTSQVGKAAPKWATVEKSLLNAFDIQSLKKMDVIITCQGSGYTEKVLSDLRIQGWEGYWIDASSALRVDESSVLLLDPVNDHVIEKGLKEGKKNFIGSNCTVSLMLMALSGLFKEGVIEWVSSMTYQAASGAGAQNMLELLQQMNYFTSGEELVNPAEGALKLDQDIREKSSTKGFPTERFGAPLALNLLPFIDAETESGQSREEWKAMAEANKILGLPAETIKVDGTCVRVSSMRSHAQGFTVKLKKDLPLEEIEKLIKQGNEWVHFVPNNKEQSLAELTPNFVSGTMKIAVGRVRKMNLGPQYLNVFSVGDQLLWGAAEPLRRMLLKLV